MNKLLVITVLAALLAINVEGFRVPRQVDDADVVDAVPAVEEEVVDAVAAVETEIVEAVAAVEEKVEQQGTLTKMTNAFRTYYDSAVNTASGYLDNIKGLKLEEKAQSVYAETAKIVSTYAGIVQDQIYHMYQQQ